jgi:hypothetical protein
VEAEAERRSAAAAGRAAAAERRAQEAEGAAAEQMVSLQGELDRYRREQARAPPR